MIYPYRSKWPAIHETAFVAPSADVMGDVEVGSHSSVWFQCVVRGDVHRVRIGSRTNIQDHCVLHVARNKSPLHIGDDCTVGHRVILHGCTIGNRVLVGMGAIVMDDAEIGDDCMVGAGALVTKGTKVPPGHLALGAPAKVGRKLTEEELKYLGVSATNYVAEAAEYQGVISSASRHGRSTHDLVSQFEDGEEIHEDS